MTFHRKISAAASLLLAFVLFAAPSHRAVAGEIHLFAAASTTTVMNKIADLYKAKGAGTVIASYASSSALATQIINGAPADIFVSANESWMNYAVSAKAIDAATRRDLLTNQLVLIAPAATHWSLTIARGFPLAKVLGDGHLAMGDPDFVPAGIYGREALISLGVWNAVSNRVARASDVRAALALVERGEAAAGVVYATDAAITKKVRVVGTFPPSTHPPIRYPAAIVAGHATPEVKRFFDFLSSKAALAVYRRYGFGLATPPASR